MSETYQYLVHRASRHPHVTEVHLPSGEQIEATVSAVELELVAADHLGGTVLLRLLGAAAEAAAVKYHRGDVVSLSLDMVKAAEPEAPAEQPAS